MSQRSHNETYKLRVMKDSLTTNMTAMLCLETTYILNYPSYAIICCCILSNIETESAYAIMIYYLTPFMGYPIV